MSKPTDRPAELLRLSIQLGEIVKRFGYLMAPVAGESKEISSVEQSLRKADAGLYQLAVELQARAGAERPMPLFDRPIPPPKIEQPPPATDWGKPKTPGLAKAFEQIADLLGPTQAFVVRPRKPGARTMRVVATSPEHAATLARLEYPDGDFDVELPIDPMAAAQAEAPPPAKEVVPIPETARPSTAIAAAKVAAAKGKPAKRAKLGKRQCRLVLVNGHALFRSYRHTDEEAFHELRSRGLEEFLPQILVELRNDAHNLGGYPMLSDVTDRDLLARVRSVAQHSTPTDVYDDDDQADEPEEEQPPLRRIVAFHKPSQKRLFSLLAVGPDEARDYCEMALTEAQLDELEFCEWILSVPPDLPDWEDFDLDEWPGIPEAGPVIREPAPIIPRRKAVNP